MLLMAIKCKETMDKKTEKDKVINHLSGKWYRNVGNFISHTYWGFFENAIVILHLLKHQKLCEHAYLYLIRQIFSL